MAPSATPSKAWLSEVELLDAALEKPEVSTASLAAPNEEPEAQAAALNAGNVEALIQQGLMTSLRGGLDTAVPWFISQMPPLYQCITPRDERLEHLTEIVSGNVLTH